STGRLDAIEIYPSRDLLPTADVRRRAHAALPRYRGQFRAALERLSEGQSFEGMEQAIPLLYQPLPLLFALAPPGSLIVLSSSHRTLDRARRIAEEADALTQASGWPGPTAVHDPDLALSTRARVDLSELPAAGSVDLGIRTWERPGQSDRMAERTAELRAAGARVVLIGEGHGSLDRAKEVLAADRKSTRLNSSHGSISYA